MSVNTYNTYNSSGGGYRCSMGLIIPLINESGMGAGTRIIAYFIGMLYSFLGIAIAADIFMCAIEKICSQKRKIKVVKEPPVDPEADDISVVSDVEYVEIAFWNPTIANLTLMALGAHAPEILLTFIEMIGYNMEYGNLGASTVVGSAAFNLLVIVGVCIWSIEQGEIRRVKDLVIFSVTAGFALFSIIWLELIVLASSKGEIEIWEAFLTLLWFAAFIGAAYLADRKFFLRSLVDRCRTCTEALTHAGLEDDYPSRPGTGLHNDDKVEYRFTNDAGDDVAYPGDARRWGLIRKEVALQYPNMSNEQLAKVVASKIRALQHHDRLFYRIIATRWLNGRQSNLDEASADYTSADMISTNASLAGSTVSLGRRGKGRVSPRLCKLEFSASAYGFSSDTLGDGGTKIVRLKLVRRGRAHKRVAVRYDTVSGSAKRNEHFLPRTEMVVFAPHESEKIIGIELAQPEDSAHKWVDGMGFFVYLRLDDDADVRTKLGNCTPALIRFFEAGKGGDAVVEFVQRNQTVRESELTARCSIARTSGAVGSELNVAWSTADATAIDGRDYYGGKGELVFEAGEVAKFLDINIIDDMEEEKAETFNVHIENVDRGRLGAQKETTVAITSDDAVHEMFVATDELIPAQMSHWEHGAPTYRQQLKEAVSVNDGDLDGSTWRDVAMHVLCFPFKIVFAAVPPTSLFGGWLTFVVALFLICILTAIVADFASVFGCLLGIKQSVAAILFIAVGTSIPDLFAYRLSARHEECADNVLINATGSVAVNILLGLGFPWLLGSIFWSAQQKPFAVNADELGFTTTILAVFVVLAFSLMAVRRMVPAFGRAEFGGPRLTKLACLAFFVGLWVVYILLTVMNAHGAIPAF